VPQSQSAARSRAPSQAQSACTKGSACAAAGNLQPRESGMGSPAGQKLALRGQRNSLRSLLTLWTARPDLRL
jgi:hypothetical protein